MRVTDAAERAENDTMINDVCAMEVDGLSPHMRRCPSACQRFSPRYPIPASLSLFAHYLAPVRAPQHESSMRCRTARSHDAPSARKRSCLLLALRLVFGQQLLVGELSASLELFLGLLSARPSVDLLLDRRRLVEDAARILGAHVATLRPCRVLERTALAEVVLALGDDGRGLGMPRLAADQACERQPVIFWRR